jgi:hypothetical protein
LTITASLIYFACMFLTSHTNSSIVGSTIKSFKSYFSPIINYEISVQDQKRNLDRFILNQKNALSTQTRFDKRLRFIYVMKNTAGYGNKVYAVLTGLTLAVATNSYFIVHWPQIDNYIEESLYGCFLKDNNDSHRINDKNLRQGAFHLPPLAKNSYKLHKSFKDLYLGVPSRLYKRFVLTGGSPIFLELACNKKYFQKFLDYGLVSSETIKQAEDLLNSGIFKSGNNSFSINYLYRTGFELAHNLMNKFWRSNGKIMRQVNLYRERFFKDNYVIGMQFRFYYLKWEDVYVFFDCALRIEKRIGRKAKWLVTSDSATNLNKIKQLYPDRVLHANGTIGHVEFESGVYSRALIDIELLSVSDELIMTGGSTFGFMAALKSAKYPWFVNGGVNATECERFSLTNPSYTTVGDAVF